MNLPSVLTEEHTSPERYYSPRPIDAIGGDCTRRARSCNSSAQLFPSDFTTLPDSLTDRQTSTPKDQGPRVRFLTEIQVHEYEQADYENIDSQQYPGDWSSVSSSDADDDLMDEADWDQGIVVVFAPADRAYIPCLPNRRQK